MEKKKDKDISAMPAQSTENISAVEEAVQASLTGSEPITSSLSSLPKKVLLSNIDFKPASKNHTLQLDKIKSKYIVLNTTKKLTNSSSITASAGSNSRTEDEENNSSAMSGQRDGDGLPTPRYVIYPADKLCLEWWPRRMQKIGAGLHNLGNTCFLNATLQCLSYTPPLVNHLLSDEHTDSCKQVGFCMMCELQVHIRRCYENSGHAIKPQSILQKLKVIAKHMHFGRQEDAHEFLRYVVDALQKSCLNGYLKLDKYSRETTVINQIFGGFLRSQVQCMKCKEKSNTYDPYLDISLDIKSVQSLERAFEKYVTAEVLDHDNSYMCTRCQRKVIAEKRFTIHKPSNVLTIQLKRFDYNRYFGKIVRHITFPEKLNLRPYMSVRQGEPIMYKLYAVLVHTGHSCTSGHYFAYVRPSNQSWYCMNDNSVSEVSASRVFESEAYMLFYLRCKEKKTSTNFIGPQMPAALQNNFRVVNGSYSTSAVNDFGTAHPRKNHSLQSLHPSKSSVVTGSCNVSKTTSVPEKREKESFGIGSYSKGDTVKSASDSNSKSGEAKPRIVMQIKNGIVTTIEKPAAAGKTAEKEEEQLSKLVPYTGESESDQENKSGSSNSPQPTFPKSKSLESYCSGGRKPADSGATGDTKVVFDQSLNATTSVPGNAHLLETSTREWNNVRDSHSLDRFIPSTSPSSPFHSKDLTLKLHHRHSTSPLKRFLGDASSGGSSSSSSSSSTAPTSTTLNSTCPSVAPGTVLTCDTTSAPKQKVNSTTTWLVQSQESAVSPSLASASSSGTSINSTTEWHVTDKGDTPQYLKLPERQHTGWTVLNKEGAVGNQQMSAENEDAASPTPLCSTTPEPDAVLGPSALGRISPVGTATSSSSSAVTVTAAPNLVSMSPGNNSIPSLNLLTKESSAPVLPLKEDPPAESKRETVESNGIYCLQTASKTLDPCPKPPTITTARPNNNASSAETSSARLKDSVGSRVQTPPIVNSENTSSKYSHKKHKKHKRKRHKEKSRHSQHDTENDSLDSELVRKKKHKKHKHKRESSNSEDRRRDFDDGPSPVKRRHRSGHLQDDSAEYEWVERTKEHFRPADIPLPSPTLTRTESSNDHLTEQRSVEGPAEPPVERPHNIKYASRSLHISSSTSEHSPLLVESHCKKSVKSPVLSGMDNKLKSSLYGSSEKPNDKSIDSQSKSVYSTKESKDENASSEQHSTSLTGIPSESLSPSFLSNTASMSNVMSLSSNSAPPASSQKTPLLASVDSKTPNSGSKSEITNHRHSDLSSSSSSDRTVSSSPSSGQHKHSKTEKTQEHCSGEVSRHSKPNVSSQRWDSHIHDGYKRIIKGSDNYKMTWDGSKNSRIADELEKSCNRAYGGQMMSWDGGKSMLSQDMEHERSRNKRYCSQDYNDDYDRGKAKKIKKPRLDHMYNNSGVNSFQRLHDDRNKDKWRYNQRMLGSSYGQHPYHRSYQHYGHGPSMNHMGHYSHYMGRHAYRH